MQRSIWKRVAYATTLRIRVRKRTLSFYVEDFLRDCSSFTLPIAISVPDLSASQSPNTGIIPFSVVNLYARQKDFEQIEIENLQVFADTVTNQELKMIPLAELPDQWNKTEIFNIPAQNL